MSVRAITECEQCGQADDHPKVHFGELGTGAVVSKHHDCLSVRERAVLIGSPQERGMLKASAVIRECEAGRKGDELLGFIVGDHDATDLAVGVQEG